MRLRRTRLTPRKRTTCHRMLGTTAWALGRRGRSAKRPNDHRSARSENDESQDPHHNAGNGRAPEPKEADLECCTGRDKHLLLRWRKERRHRYPDPAVPSVTAIRGQAPLRDGHRARYGDERLLAAFTKALLVGLASQFLRGQAHGVTAKSESLICRLSLVGSDAESRGSIGCRGTWYPLQDSNSQPPDPKSGALSIELSGRNV